MNNAIHTQCWGLHITSTHFVFQVTRKVTLLLNLQAHIQIVVELSWFHYEENLIKKIKCLKRSKISR